MKWLRFTYLIIFLLVFVAPAQAGDTAAPRFGTMAIEPYGYFTPEGEPAGYIWELSNAITAEAGFNQDNKILPQKRLLAELRTKRRDCAIFAATPLAKSLTDLIEPVGKSLQGGILPRTGIKLSRYEDLHGLTIAMPRGVSFNKRLETDPKINIIRTGGYKQDAQMLMRNRIDAVGGAIDSHLHTLMQLGAEPKTIGQPLVMSEIPLWLTCAPDSIDAATTERLKTATQKLRQNGAFAKIIEKYLGTHQFIATGE